MINIRSSRKINLLVVISAVFLASFCILSPFALGYGDDFHSAETLVNGTYYETMISSDDVAFYKVYCGVGDYLQLNISCYTHIAMYLYDPHYDQVGYRGTPSWGGSGDLDYVVTEEGAHYLRFARTYDMGTGDVDFTIEVSGATGSGGSPGSNGIPGYELITLVIGGISISCLFYLKKKQKNYRISK